MNYSHKPREWQKLFKINPSTKQEVEAWSCSRYEYAVDPEDGMIWVRYNY